MTKNEKREELLRETDKSICGVQQEPRCAHE